MFINGLDSILDKFDIFFGEGFVKSDKTTAISTGILYVGRFPVEPFFDGVLRDNERHDFRIIRRTCLNFRPSNISSATIELERHSLHIWDVVSADDPLPFLIFLYEQFVAEEFEIYILFHSLGVFLGFCHFTESVEFSRCDQVASVIRAFPREPFFLYFHFAVIIPKAIRLSELGAGRSDKLYFVIMSNSSPFHDGFGSAVRNFSTVSNSRNSVNTDP